MGKYQKVVTITNRNGAYYNFWNTPGSQGSMQQMVNDGWRVVHVKDDSKRREAVVIFERYD